MSCTGYSVVQGTAISSFNASVVDVLNSNGSASAGVQGASILVRVSGPAVDSTGVGEGFSGSPVYCPDSQGVQRNIGAVAEGVGDVSNKLALLTPIEAILGEPVVPPASARSDSSVTRSAHALTEPLTVSGVSPSVAALFQTAAARAGRTLYATPGTARTAYPVQTLRPGSSVAVGLSSGDIATGAIGTVAYTDGNNVWAFGHPLDSAGRRSLLLEDAYVYTVINNPLSSSGNVTTFKLAAPGHDLGTLTNDGLNAVVGQVGALPPRFPLQVVAHSTDSGAALTLNDTLADESAIGQPTGVSSLSLVTPLATAQAATLTLHGAPAQQSGSMCLQINVQESKVPLGFCNSYVLDGTSDLSGTSPQDNTMTPYLDDLGTALQNVDSFKLGILHVTNVKVTLQLGHGVREGYMLAARGPRQAVAPGHVAKVAVLVQVVRGARTARVISVRVPRHARRGTYLLRLSGTPADSAGNGAISTLVALLSPSAGGQAGAGVGDAGPPTVDALQHQIAAIHRFDGVRARFVRGSAGAAGAAAKRRGGSSGGGGGSSKSKGRNGGGGVPVYRDPSLRLSGTAVAAIRIR